MTVSNEFIPSGGQAEETGGQEIFGIKLTPQVQAIAIAVLGLGVAGYLGYQFVLPEWQKSSELNQKILESKQTQVQLQAQIQKKAEAEAKQEEAKQRRAQVTAMFASDASANTLLLDMTQLVNKINAGVQGDDLKAKITKFEPDVPPAAATAAPGAPDPDILSDTSFGPSLAGKLRRKKYKVEFEGNFAQTRNFMRNLELMQSLLVVRNLKSELLASNQAIEIDFLKGKIVPVEQPQTKIKTAFDLHALLPLKEEEKPPTPVPSPAAK
ncbi:pilus assembly protein PilO [Microcoleus sp. LEGE 07076]|uniref:pilus assembly protein PilO n=1 Tax=Microcoleus sp. LEGE 07076 TaxID=915322 RepID=UPI00187E8AFF|nr:pilus assembly protein PilO [Microcoleus sp. LEGE 07076]MBE9187387.1 pilus assembly protein PilO [Microcoleus sp. LEGE 07076]